MLQLSLVILCIIYICSQLYIGISIYKREITQIALCIYQASHNKQHIYCVARLVLQNMFCKCAHYNMFDGCYCVRRTTVCQCVCVLLLLLIWYMVNNIPHFSIILHRNALALIFIVVIEKKKWKIFFRSSLYEVINALCIHKIYVRDKAPVMMCCALIHAVHFLHWNIFFFFAHETCSHMILKFLFHMWNRSSDEIRV